MSCQWGLLLAILSWWWQWPKIIFSTCLLVVANPSSLSLKAANPTAGPVVPCGILLFSSARKKPTSQPQPWISNEVVGKGIPTKAPNVLGEWTGAVRKGTKASTTPPQQDVPHKKPASPKKPAKNSSSSRNKNSARRSSQSSSLSSNSSSSSSHICRKKRNCCNWTYIWKRGRKKLPKRKSWMGKAERRRPWIKLRTNPPQLHQQERNTPAKVRQGVSLLPPKKNNGHPEGVGHVSHK